MIIPSHQISRKSPPSQQNLLHLQNIYTIFRTSLISRTYPQCQPAPIVLDGMIGMSGDVLKFQQQLNALSSLIESDRTGSSWHHHLIYDFYSAYSTENCTEPLGNIPTVLLYDIFVWLQLYHINVYKQHWPSCIAFIRLHYSIK